jgi:hypothetical protein
VRGGSDATAEVFIGLVVKMGLSIAEEKALCKM